MSWLNPSIGSSADAPGPPSWNLVKRSQVSIPYDGPSGPEYFTYADIIPDLSKLPLERVDDPSKQLVAITAKASLLPFTTNLNYYGFFGAGWFYYRRFAGPYLDSWPNNIPSLVQGDPTNIYSPAETSVEYTPTSLPIGGVNYPIWTQRFTDPQTIIVRVDLQGEQGIPWFITGMQVVDSVIESPAVRLDIFYKWSLIPQTPSRYSKGA